MITVKLKELAQAKGYKSISDFQRASGATIGTVRRWWKDETTGVDWVALEPLCDFLDCEPGDLIKRVKKETKNE